ncbi:mechanosensitive ion channel domain-containing protein [Allorhodopirellula heiligendammensis]|uniref:Mechanosensitive channel MscK n=1 Tax=Allorhodopirellula heiligendammensis TaxID=2714739 RepID=A0A5C6BWW9_9BACT|nr:mechanosensitive ion channel domain-containing protein [Allorhodopirellula heiligendammensis]TWU16332.1 Mechanosensitive channel MscK precursor [Allorhodopirellula heiligendammensis]
MNPIPLPRARWKLLFCLLLGVAAHAPCSGQNAHLFSSPRPDSPRPELQRPEFLRPDSLRHVPARQESSAARWDFSDADRSAGWGVPQSPLRSAQQSQARFREIADANVAPISEVANDNAHFVEQWIDLAERHSDLSERLDQATAKLQATSADLDDITSKIEHYGLTPTIGLLLRSKQDQLDQWQVRDSDNSFVSEDLARARALQLAIEMVDHDGSNVQAQSERLWAATQRPASVSEKSQLQALLRDRHQWLTALRQGYEDYQQKLSELDTTTRASTKLTSDYRRLVDRHITWIRSGQPLGLSDLKQLRSGLAALLDARRSGDFGYSLQRKWVSDSVAGIGLMFSIVVILIVRWRAKTWLIGIGERKRLRHATTDARLLVASVLTVTVALTLPTVLYAIARWLGSGYVSESTLNASSGFYAAALVALLVEVPRQLLRNWGYVDKHVAVELPRRERASNYLKLIGFALVMAAYLISLTAEIDHGIWRGSVARVGFIVAMSLVAWTLHLSLRPSGGFLEPLIAKLGGHVIHRIRFVIYIIGVGFPLAMIALTALGYGFTAIAIIQRAIITVAALLIAVTLWPAVKILSARGWALLTGTAPPPSSRDEHSDHRDPVDSSASGVLAEHYLELKHQLAFLCQCALVFATIASVAWLWIDIFPSMHLGNPVVWNVHDTVTNSVVNEAGQTMVSSSVETTPITMLHLGFAALTLFVAFQLAKLLPALFDALVLQRVSFDEGMEHFSLVLGRFVLFAVGCFIACKTIGIRWQTIQWLAVGLTIGLGFGLQDMVRNLFGGLIVLFEKPAHLGDFISVGNVRGRVAAQRLRTTILSDDDGREVIIPNQNFVGEQVVNWRGAGRLSVIPVEVAVSRDERPADVCRLLTELAIEQDDVLLTPTPQATLVCVGKRSQRIELRVWIEDGHDAEVYRDALLRLVRRYLAEKNWLAKTQPAQPPMRDRWDGSERDAPRRRSRNGRAA